MASCAQGRPQSGLGRFPARLLPARCRSPRFSAESAQLGPPRCGRAPQPCACSRQGAPFPECTTSSPSLSPQPLPVPVDHQQQRRGRRGTGRRGSRRVPGGLSPGEPGGGVAAARPGARLGRRGGPGRALADQHRRVHLDEGGLAPLPGLGRRGRGRGRGRAPVPLLAGRLGGVPVPGRCPQSPRKPHAGSP